MVDCAALEMPCPLPGPGFESRTLRQKACGFHVHGLFYVCKKHQQSPLLKKIGEADLFLNEFRPG